MPDHLGQLDPVGGGDPIPLLKEELQIGRRSHCDITLRFPNVSSHHCMLSYRNGYWYIEDTNSRNGIKVNDIRCQQKYLMPGDILSIAKHDYKVLYEPQGTEPPPDVEEDMMSMSLMEKAGLVSRKRDRETGRPETPEPAKIKPPQVIETPDDEALVWLLDDPEDEEKDDSST